jgi:hypothetical protein
MTRERFCMVIIEKELAEAITGNKAMALIKDDYEKQFKRSIPKTVLVERIIFKWAVCNGLLSKDGKVVP